MHKDRYIEDALYYAPRFDFSNDDLQKNGEIVNRAGSHSKKHRTALWVIPHFLYAYYGGIHTILRFADFLTRNYGIRNSFAVLGVYNITFQPELIRNAFPSLASSSFYPVTNEDLSLSHIPDHDIGFCTAWQTAYPLLKFNRLKKKFYFMQDYEPYFYPAGSISGLAEATYRFGFTAICNTIALKKTYEEYGGTAVHFSPVVDHNIFYPPEVIDTRKPVYNIMFYGRPFGVRNCFEVAAEAMKKVKQYFGARVRIVSAGGEWNLNEYGLQGIVENLDRLPYEQTGHLFRTCDIGLAMMMTRHTSYIPIELMACGCLVVSNKSKWKDWLLKDRENCLLAEPSASCIAESIVEGLLDQELRKTLVQNAIKNIQERPGWDEQFHSVVREIF